MSEVSRVTAIWTGFSGAPGYSRFSFQPLADDTARNAAGLAIRTFFDGIKAYLPNGCTINVQPQVDNLDLVTGDLLGSATMTTTPTVVTSSAAIASYAAGSGFVITWLAAGIFNSRRIRGRTFIVPAVGVYFTDGTITVAAATAAQAAGTALINTVGADLAIWNRQYSKTDPPVPIAGNLSSATSCVVRDQSSQLRSRRV